MPRTAVLGLPRVGPDRELKFALEEHWAGRSSADQLQTTARALRAANWRRAQAAGIDVIPSGDFSLYDHVLDTAWALGTIPDRFGGPGADGLDAYFGLARGTRDARPLEMTKWFDTNYHYLVPELHPRQQFHLRATHWLEQLTESRDLGIPTRPVVLGPITFLLLSKGVDRPLDLLDDLVPVYEQLLHELKQAGAAEVQLDEPALVKDRTASEIDAFVAAVRALEAAGPDICVATYFDRIDERALKAPVAEFHVDLVRAPQQLEGALAACQRVSLGVVDGRNVWITDPDVALRLIDTAVAALGEDRVTIAPSCSLLHIPHEAKRERNIDPEVKRWLAFGAERLAELAALNARDARLQAARQSIAARRASRRANNPQVRERAANLRPADYDRSAPYPSRHAAQRERVPLPELPTTTIGSFPQTPEIRAARRDLRTGELDQGGYERFIEGQIADTIATQERLGLDVLVHGESERTDMVEYFGQQLDGFAFSDHGWVQSYGSRCVKPPILYGDVARPAPMTVRWWRHAQSLTDKPVKGMLTGPVTILQWSFARDDQPRSETCTQIALAIQDEVLDLERAGAFAVQVDEAALREALPLRRRDHDAFLRWAVDCFRLATAPVGEETQVHTHMCYSDFNDIMEHVARLDADVLSIEASRSDMHVLDVFAGAFEYPNEIGPGVYDIHSPRVPSTDEIERLLELAEARIGRDRLWVNPDCGLKTRRWEEVLPALEHMVQAAHHRRAAAPAPA